MDKEGVIYSYTMKCYLAIKKNKMFAICSNMDGLWGHYSKWNKSVRKGQHCQISPLCGIWKIQQTSKCVKKKKNSRFRLFLFSHSVISDFVIPSTEVYQAFLSFTNFWSLLKLMSIEFSEAIQPFHPLSPPFCHPVLCPSSRPQSLPAHRHREQTSGY